MFYIILWIPPPGGFVGDGHPVFSGQPTAGEVQDTGWNRWDNDFNTNKKDVYS